MKKILILAALVAASCTAIETPSDLKEMKFTAGISTKTVLDGSSVLWSQGDAMSVFDGSSNRQFTTSGSGAAAAFSGVAASASVYYALYPFDEANSFSAGVITSAVPPVQTAVAGGFAPLSNLSAGVTSTDELQMMNVCSYVKVGISEGGKYTSLSVIAEGGEYLAGPVSITFEDGVPVATGTSGAKSQVKIIPSGETLDAGVYYIPVIPGTLSSGLQLILNTSGGKIYSKTEPYASILTRRTPLYLGNADEGTTEQAATLSLDEDNSCLAPEAGETSAVIAVTTTSSEVSATVKAGATLQDISITKTAYNRFQVEFTNPSVNPEDMRSATIVLSSEGCEDIEATISQRGLLNIPFNGGTFTPALPTAASTTETTHSFTVGSNTYEIGMCLFYSKTSYLLFKGYDTTSAVYGHVLLPAITGLTLRKVYINFKKHSSNYKCALQVQDTDGYAYSETLSRNDLNTEDCTDSLTLSNPSAGVAYRLKMYANVNCLVYSLDVVYD